VQLGGGGSDGQALPAPAVNAQGGARFAHPTGGSGGIVEEPTLAEEMNDDLPF
jgi:hypothetical protein